MKSLLIGARGMFTMRGESGDRRRKSKVYSVSAERHQQHTLSHSVGAPDDTCMDRREYEPRALRHLLYSVRRFSCNEYEPSYVTSSLAASFMRVITTDFENPPITSYQHDFRLDVTGGERFWPFVGGRTKVPRRNENGT